jgi:hypothetical protein
VKENSIEETIKQLKLMLKVRKQQKEIIECADGSCMNCNPDIKALIESIDILSDYKRVLKINEVLLKENEELNSKIPNLEQGTEILMEINTKLTNELNDSISKQKIKDIINRIDYDIKKTKEIISKNTNIYASYRKNSYQITRLKAINTKSLDIKKRLQELLESEE